MTMRMGVFDEIPDLRPDEIQCPICGLVYFRCSAEARQIEQYGFCGMGPLVSPEGNALLNNMIAELEKRGYKKGAKRMREKIRERIRE